MQRRRRHDEDATMRTRRRRRDDEDVTTQTQRRRRHDEEDATTTRTAQHRQIRLSARRGSGAGLALKSWLKRAGVKSDGVGKHISNSHYAASPHPSAWKLCVYQTHTMQLQLTIPPYRPVAWHFEGSIIKKSATSLKISIVKFWMQCH